MKTKYERPLIKAELFQTNAYCGSCTGQVQLNGKLIVDEINPGGWTWNPDRVNYTTHHEFKESNKTSMINSNTGQQQYYYNCLDGDGYYLEYSAHWSESQELSGGNPTFFLYKETNGKNGLQLAASNGPWPTVTGRGDNKSDTCVAKVVYDQGTSPVINS